MADAIEECKALAERLGAPVVNSYLHNDSFPASHPLWCGPLGYQGSKAGMRLIAQADVRPVTNPPRTRRKLAQLALALFLGDPGGGDARDGEGEDEAGKEAVGVLHGHRFPRSGPRNHYAMTWGDFGG